MLIGSYNRKQKHIDELMWTMGLYITHGISTIGKGKYPDKPFSQDIQENSGNGENLSEDEKRNQVKMLFASLQVLGTNANLAKKRKEEQDNGGSAE